MRQIDQIGRHPRNRGKPGVGSLIQAWQRAQKPHRIGVPCPLVNLHNGASFDDVSGIHHIDLPGKVGDYTQIMGDPHDSHPKLLLEASDQIYNLCLDGDVQRSSRFVGNEEFRVAGEAHCDHRPLPHTAGELVRIVIQSVTCIRDAHQGQEFGCSLAGLPFANHLVQHQSFHDLKANGVGRVEGGHGILEDHRQLGTSDQPHLLAANLQQVSTVKPHLAALDAPRRAGNQAHDGEGVHALATPTLTDDPQSLPLFHGVGKTIDRMDNPVLGVEPGGQIIDLQQRCHTVVASRSRTRGYPE